MWLRVARDSRRYNEADDRKKAVGKCGAPTFSAISSWWLSPFCVPRSAVQVSTHIGFILESIHRGVAKIEREKRERERESISCQARCLAGKLKPERNWFVRASRRSHPSLTTMVFFRSFSLLLSLSLCLSIPPSRSFLLEITDRLWESTLGCYAELSRSTRNTCDSCALSFLHFRRFQIENALFTARDIPPKFIPSTL